MCRRISCGLLGIAGRGSRCIGKIEEVPDWVPNKDVADAFSRASQMFPRAPASAAACRRFLSEVLAPIADAIDMDAAVLLTSELVNNAILHTSGPRIKVEVIMGDDSLHIGVIDGSPKSPLVLPARPGDVGGWGLRIVQQMSACWGVEEMESRQKCVWFRVPVTPHLLDRAPPRSPR